MVAKSSTDTWVAKVEVATTASDRRRLNSVLNAVRLSYNAALGEALKRLRQMRRPKAWSDARDLPKAEARTIYKELRERAGFSEFSLVSWLVKSVYWKDHENRIKTDIGMHLNTKILATIGRRAQETVERYWKNPKARPRFRRFGETSLIPSKSGGPIRLKQGKIHFKNDFCSLQMSLLLDSDDLYHAAINAVDLKYAELKRERIRDKDRWFAVLVMRGTSPRKQAHAGNAAEIVGVDVGTQTVAVVGDPSGTPLLETLSPSSAPLEAKKRLLQRKLDRQRRAANPDAYDERGRVIVKRGYRWKQSKRYKRTRKRFTELMRRQKVNRKLEHQKLSNEIIKCGATVRMEDLSWKGFQMGRYGKTQGFRAPGLFCQLLTYAAERAGGNVELINTRKTALSQYNHATDKREKEASALHKRWKVIDGEKVHRDLYSAFLARHTHQDLIDRSAILKEWPAACSALQRAVDRDLTSGVRHVPSSLGVTPRGQGSAAESGDGRLRADGRDSSPPRKRSVQRPETEKHFERSNK